MTARIHGHFLRRGRAEPENPPFHLALLAVTQATSTESGRYNWWSRAKRRNQVLQIMKTPITAEGIGWNTYLPVLLSICFVGKADSTDFYLGGWNKAFGPTYAQILSPTISKLECSLRCGAATNCDGYNYTPAPSQGSSAKCQLFAMNLTTTASTSNGTEAWLRGTPTGPSSSGFATVQMYTDRKLYAFIHAETAAYTDAHTYCPGMGATVASPNSLEKFDFFTRVLAPPTVYTYLGMKDIALAGLFVDSRGDTYPSSLNYPGEPGGQGPDQDCLISWGDDPNYQPRWVVGDDWCTTTGPWICEFPRKDLNVGCFEQPPKPEGAVYQNWDGYSYPIGVGTTITSVCPSGEHFHSGISTYATTCGSDGYWSKPAGNVPFCTGSDGYLKGNGTTCYKLLKDATIFASSAEARCQRHGGKTLTFTAVTASIFKSLIFPPGSTATQAKAIAGYNDLVVDGTFKDAAGNVLPLSSTLWEMNQPDGGAAQNYAYVWYPTPSTGYVYDDYDTNQAQLICVFSTC